MMEKLQQRAEALAEAAEENAKAALKTALAAELPPALSVAESDEGVTVTGRGLGRDMIEHSGLRDVAFLMRGVR